MKKIVPFLISLFICALSSGVQAQEAKSLWLDLRVGFNGSFILNQNAYGNGELDYAPTVGLTAGPGASYFLSDTWGVNTSLTWSMLGQNYSGSQSGGDAKRKVNLNYLELPLLAMRKFEGSKKPAWIAFGPELMFLTSANQDYQRDGGAPLPAPENMLEGTTDIKERFKPVDVAVNISFNKIYDVFENRKLRLLITANMVIGLTDINSKDWQTANIHGDYGASHNFYMGIKAGLMYKAFVKEN